MACTRRVAALALASAGLVLLNGCSSKEDGASAHTTGGGAGKAMQAAGGSSATGGSSGGGSAAGGAAGKGTGGAGGGTGGAGGSGMAGGGSGGKAAGSGGSAGMAAGGSAGSGGSAGAGSSGEAGWLYTEGGQLMLSDGKGSGTAWVGRGVNTDDIFFCGYNNSLWMDSPEDTLVTVLDEVITGWKPSFIRISLSMASNATTTSWLMDEATYKTPMTKVINSITQHGVYALVTLRSDLSMIGQDQTHGDPEATGIPSDSTSSPDKTAFPRGTDPVYESLVDVFGSSKFVLFGLTNEPGGNLLTDSQISKAMDHAVTTIRAEEDKLGVPHHIVSVQGNGWTSDISTYADTPLTEDNVVYEVHGYPPKAESYTYANIPVILGEYGSLVSGSESAFYADLEQKKLSSLAWDLDSYSNCAPDLVEVDASPSNLTPTDWGNTVKQYLAAHAQ